MSNNTLFNAATLESMLKNGHSIDEIATSFAETLNLAQERAEEAKRHEEERAEKLRQEKELAEKRNAQMKADADFVLRFYRTYFPNTYKENTTVEEFLANCAETEHLHTSFEKVFSPFSEYFRR